MGSMKSHPCDRRALAFSPSPSDRSAISVSLPSLRVLANTMRIQPASEGRQLVTAAAHISDSVLDERMP